LITLVLGGARSGKSALAERWAARLPEPVNYVATTVAATVAADPEMAARVATHQARRPAGWRTVEAGGQLCAALSALEGTVLIDALGAWVAAHRDFDVDAAGLCRALTARGGDTVVVSEEVGLGVHPSSDAGRRFRDALGEVNQAVAAIADRVVLVVAGRVLRLEDPNLDDANFGELSARP
jgi:adenosyl cobinamide kinase/adenosyl cobinamide phosphate guanylyltransferase